MNRNQNHQMLYFNKKKIFLCAFFFSAISSMAQTEFRKEFIMHVKLSTGLISAPFAPELFVGSVQLIPQYTIIPYKMRGGVVAAGFYSARKVHGLFGPTLSYKLIEFKGGFFGSIGNLHISADHLWGTARQRLAGGGVNLDLLNIVVVGLSVHRDYHFANWWVQSSLAYRISKIKKPKESFPH